MRRQVCLAAGLWCALAAIAWSQDERKGRSLFVMAPDGSGVRPVASVPGYGWIGSPSWSHDGKQLAFDARNPDPNANRLYVVGVNGTGLTSVGPGMYPDWTPDDKQLAFAAGISSSLEKGVWVQNIDGRGRQRLGNGVGPRWSPDGSLLAVHSDTLKILDLTDSSERPLFQPVDGVKKIATGFCWSPDGQQIAVSAQLGASWQLVIVHATGAPELRVRAAGEARGLTWSPDGKTLIAALYDKAAQRSRLYTMTADGDANDDPPREIPGQTGDNREPSFSPDGTLVAFASSRGGAARTPKASGNVALELAANFDSGGTCYSVGISPDGRTALLGGNMGNRRLRLWDMETGETKRSIDILGIFVAMSPDGRHAATSEHPKTTVHYLDLESGTSLREFALNGPVLFVDFSADGSRLACGSRSGMVLIFDVASGEALAKFEHKTPMSQGALSPDGKTLATSAADNKVRLWDVATGKERLAIDQPFAWGLAFSPDGRYLATGAGGPPVGNPADQVVPVGADNLIRLWDVAAGKLVSEFRGHKHAVRGLAFSPDSSRLASGSFDGTLRLWDVDKGSLLAVAEGQSWIFKVAFSPDGETILTSGGNAKHGDAKIVDYPQERVRVYKIVPQP